MFDFRHNSEFRNALIGLAAAVIFLGVAALPFVLNWDLMQFGFGVAFLALFVSCACFIGFVFYAFRAWKLQRILKGQGVLAHWKYDRRFWEQFVNADIHEERQNKRGLWMLVAGICLLVSIIAIVFDQEAGWIIAAVLLAIIVITGILAVVAPAFTRRQRMGRPGEVFIARNGVWLAGELHLWEPKFLLFFDSVRLRLKPQPVLVFEYGGISHYSYRQEFVRVPVPPGKLAEAKRIVALFEKQ